MLRPHILLTSTLFFVKPGGGALHVFCENLSPNQAASPDQRAEELPPSRKKSF